MADDQYSPLVSDQKVLNVIKYAARDFVTIADDLLRRLKIEYEDDYNDFATTSQGIMLRDLCAWAYAALTWYLDRTASDMYLETARTRAAVERLVSQIGYKMTPAAAGSTSVELTFPDGTPGPFDMKNRWRYLSKSGYQYESDAKFEQATALSAGETVSIDVRQGETRTLTYTADGSKNQIYRMSSIDEDRFLGADSVEIWVDGLLWEEKDFLEFQATNQNHYEVNYMSNPPFIRFGDGLAGNIPPAGAEVKIRFRIIDGEKGSVTSDSIQTSIDTLTIAGETVTFTVNNASPAKGRDPEKAESAKRWAPVSFAARGAAITQPDYQAFANSYVDPSYGAVAKAYAINPRERYDDLIFNDMVYDIDGILLEFNTSISTSEENLSTNSSDMSSILTALGKIYTALDTYREAMSGWAEGANSSADGALTNMEIAESRALTANEQSSVALTALASLKDAIQDGASTEEMSEYADSAIAAVTTAQIESDAARVAAGGAKDTIHDNVLSNTSHLVTYLQDSGVVDTQLDSMSTNVTSMGDVVDDILENVGLVSVAGQDVATDVSAKTDEMSDRIGELFSDDCLSNYVQVPILSFDLDGNYVAPPIGLRLSLNNRLNEIKEVTQVVEVVDGSSAIVRANIAVRVEILDGFVPAEVVSQIRSIIVGMLKRRDFNSPLYLDALYAVKDMVTGIDYINITITDSTPENYVDLKGNLVPPSNKVIAYGSLTITDPNGDPINMG